VVPLNAFQAAMLNLPLRGTVNKSEEARMIP